MRRYRSAFILFATMAIGTSSASDFSLLKPPQGAALAVVMFADLQCHECASAYPLVWSAAQAHHVPVIWHDAVARNDRWAERAAVFARYFATKSPMLANQFRAYMLKNQAGVNLGNFIQFAQRFADQNKVPLPFAIDPVGNLQNKVQADSDLGRRVGITQIPTIVVVTRTSAREVNDVSTLSTVIQDMQK